VREERVLLALDEAALLAGKAGILALAYLVERVAQVAQDVELVEQDGGLRGIRGGDLAKRLPHVHHRQAEAFGLLFPEPIVELLQALFRAILAAEPDRPAPPQIAHHDAVDVVLAYGDLIQPNDLRGGRAGALELRAHVLLVQLLDRVPIELELLGHGLDRAVAAATAHVVGKTLGVERVVGEKLQPLALHLAAPLAGDTPYLQLEVYAGVRARQIAHPSRAPIVPAEVNRAARAADGFFDRRVSVTRRIFGSPNAPRTVSWGRKPGKAYPSVRRRRGVRVGIRQSCQLFSTVQWPAMPISIGLAA
jgi:hypothetical protein